MPSFRRYDRRGQATASASLEHVRHLIQQVLRPGHFFVPPSKSLEWDYTPRESIAWEIFRGRLLDRSQTTEQRAFETWKVFAVEPEGRSTEPLLALLLDATARQVHVTRAILCHVWEGYHAGDNVYLSREVRKWVRELVATIDLDCFADSLTLQDELVCRLFQAVVGNSRLPLTSVEAPLPAFSLGELGYVYRSSLGAGEAPSGPMRSGQDLVRLGLHSDLAWLEKAKLLELLLRSTPAAELGTAADQFAARWRQLGHPSSEIAALLRTLFEEVALSPYTDFVAKTLTFLELLADRRSLSVEEVIDFLSYLLRDLGRHLTAFDLITFHHRGANYPDALLLDGTLKAYLQQAERHPGLFAAGDEGEATEVRKRIRRRALRQGCLLRSLVEGLPVPDAPTSPGENARILPPPHERVPEEQILNPSKRTRRLYADEPLAGLLTNGSRQLLRQSVQDLHAPSELRELGMALFLDRPFSVGKAPGEPDQTLLFSYEAFSRSIALQRLLSLTRYLPITLEPAELDSLQAALRDLPVSGIPLAALEPIPQPGIVSLHDARKVAEDFVFLRTTRQSVSAFLAQFDFTRLAARLGLDYLSADQRVLIVRSGDGVLTIHDAQVRRRLELRVDPSHGYASRAGSEYPVAGLRVRRAWEPVNGTSEPREVALPSESVEVVISVSQRT